MSSRVFAAFAVRIGRAIGRKSEAIAANPLIAIERKSPSDIIPCMSHDRARFEKELRRASATLDRFAIVIESSMADSLAVRRGLHPHAFLGTLACRARRYRHPILFAGDVSTAANLALRFLLGPVREAQQTVRAVRRYRAGQAEFPKPPGGKGQAHD